MVEKKLRTFPQLGHRKAFEEMNKAFDEYNIKPVIEKVYSFEETVAAYQHLAEGAFGKISDQNLISW